jgi:ABC-2 type transport system permease protein
VTALSPSEIPPLLENGSRPPGFFARVKDIWAYRDLLGNLVRRELKVRYKDSFLGFLWTLLNPLLYLVVFSIVFTKILPGGAPRYGLLLLSALLAFNLFSVGLTAATTSITANGPLVQKVWFPREILPLASILANLITFFFQGTVLIAGLVFYQQSPQWSMLWLLLPALVAILILATGLGLLLSALNVYFRDVQHFLELGLLTLFWMTPVVYPYSFAAAALRGAYGVRGEHLLLLNPLVPIIATFKRVLYNPNNFALDANSPEGSVDYLGEGGQFEFLMRPTSWYLQNLAVSGAVGLGLLFIGFKVFSRLEANFGEQI